MRGLIVFGVLVLSLSSCFKRVDFPNQPQITFLGIVLNSSAVNQTDSIGFVKLAFTDGDGDLGLNAGDTLGLFAPEQPYYYNLFIHYFEKQNGKYVEFKPVFPFHVRFKSLTPEGADKSLEGEMEVGFFSRPGTPFDTVRYEIYLVDRAFHHSDTIVTPDIILPF
ncbi:hypothetical protein ACFLR1_01685 [Bacteroidota bacterium]